MSGDAPRRPVGAQVYEQQKATPRDLGEGSGTNCKTSASVHVQCLTKRFQVLTIIPSDQAIRGKLNLRSDVQDHQPTEPIARFTSTPQPGVLPPGVSVFVFGDQRVPFHVEAPTCGVHDSEGRLRPPCQLLAAAERPLLQLQAGVASWTQRQASQLI